MDGAAAAPSGFLSAAETLGLIAYGDTQALVGSALAPGEPPMMETWGVVAVGHGPARRHSLVFAMRWTLARVRWRLTRGRRRGAWRRCPLPSLGKERRRHLRHLWRQHGRQPATVLLRDLIRDVTRAERAAKAQAAELRHASARIGGAVLSGQLHPLGRRGSFASRTLAALDHEPIPAAFFNHHHRVVTHDGWATLDPDAVSVADHALWRRSPDPDWGDLRFPTDEAMRLWAPVPSAPLTLADLPAQWTMMEAVAWIATRDPEVVRRADLTQRPPQARSAAGCPVAPPPRRVLPDGAEVEADWPSGRGIPCIWLDLEHAAADASGRAGTLGSDAAIEALVARLRSGDLTATAEWHESGERRDMPAAEWRRLTLDHLPGEDRVLVPHRVDTGGGLNWPDRRWRDVLVARDAVVRLWKPLGQTAEGMPPRPPKPSPPPAATVSGPEPNPAASAPPKRKKGGRPEREDWVSFDREMMRRLALDGGNLTLRAFTRSMKDWAAQNMDPVPDDRTIERRVDARAPKDVFVPD